MALGADNIRQNGPALAKVAARLQDIAREFQQNYETMYSLLDKNLGNSTEDSKIWYGPRAEGCKNLAMKEKDKFEQMKNDLNNLAQTIEAQAQAWGLQQSKKY